ncbi:ATP-binding protein [Flavobacterium sp. RHBU_3]|uniref:tetratricopeptide repeat-containing sensor histidine kinase n=1 Tax=Flavobacterium sp. RHBU_3 TaxID=3391184 RepID=UPI0039853C28
MKKTFTLFILILLVLAAACSRRKNSKDELGELAYLERTDNMSLTERTRILDSMYTETKTRPEDSLNQEIMKVIAYRYYYDDEMDKHMSIMRFLYSSAEKREDSATLAFSLYNIASNMEARNVLDSAYYYRLRAQNIYEKLNDTLNFGLSLHGNARVLFIHGNFSEAEAEEIKAIRLLQKANDKEALNDAYVSLSNDLSSMQNYDKALSYLEIALKGTHEMAKSKIPEEKILWHRQNIYNNMGVLYDKKGDYATAIKFYTMAMELNTQSDKISHALFLGNIGYAKMMQGYKEKDYAPDLFESLRILDSMKESYFKLETEKSIAKHYLHKKDTLAAVALLRKTYTEAVKEQSSNDEMEVLSLLAVNDHHKGAYYSKLYFELNDSLQRAERAMRNKFARIAFETESVENQNKSLHRRVNYTLWAAIVLGLFAIGTVVIIRLRARNKELLYIQEQQEANEKIYSLLLQQESSAENAKMEERNRIAMELHDGVINRIFTTRFNLMQLETEEGQKKELLVNELQETQDEIRKLSHDLKESFTGDESYAEALKQLVSRQQETKGPVFDVYVDKFINWANVSPEARVALFRIVQEACTNAKKYSNAANCNIALMAQGTMVKLRIWDDGKGFDIKKTRMGIGLRNIDERVKALGGTLNINSGEGKGTVIEVIV